MAKQLRGVNDGLNFGTDIATVVGIGQTILPWIGQNDRPGGPRVEEMETGLLLLMRDGAASVAFHSSLTAEQYAELLYRVERAETKDELREEMNQLGMRWGRDVTFDTDIE